MSLCDHTQYKRKKAEGRFSLPSASVSLQKIISDAGRSEAPRSGAWRSRALAHH